VASFYFTLLTKFHWPTDDARLIIALKSIGLQKINLLRIAGDHAAVGLSIYSGLAAFPTISVRIVT
jgi:hypothetical protein